MKRLMRLLVLAAYEAGYADAGAKVETQRLVRAAYRNGYADATSKAPHVEFGPLEFGPKAKDAREVLARIDPTNLAGLQ